MNNISAQRIAEILTPEAHKDFCNFMHGQTFQIGADGRCFIYEDDFMRWVNKEPVID